MHKDIQEDISWAEEKSKADKALAAEIERESTPTLEEMQNELYEHNAAIHREWELDYEQSSNSNN